MLGITDVGLLVYHLWECRLSFSFFFLLSCSVMSEPLQPHGLWPTMLLCPWGLSEIFKNFQEYIFKDT